MSIRICPGPFLTEWMFIADSPDTKNFILGLQLCTLGQARKRYKGTASNSQWLQEAYGRVYEAVVDGGWTAKWIKLQCTMTVRDVLLPEFDWPFLVKRIHCTSMSTIVHDLNLPGKFWKHVSDFFSFALVRKVSAYLRKTPSTSLTCRMRWAAWSCGFHSEDFKHTAIFRLHDDGLTICWLNPAFNNLVWWDDTGAVKSSCFPWNRFICHHRNPCIHWIKINNKIIDDKTKKGVFKCSDLDKINSPW